ncbi:binuclear zinc transcription factor [Magnaporthiopsis poae ATCC 64411]|uniref:Binuclear zinc transcription factor n=1 Tax=Magnaporthiopsis poae (strain ATCC 64411 / 73-15) TaxID=644358 RepID=A0A0C4DTN0_MAGP6|nr:binuclear zinc transcription factor [Magnaporthiopsis poae ATCC 64411]
MAGQNNKRPLGEVAHPNINSASASVPAPTPSPATTPALEPLACVGCRNKKLRCGREGGACARCVKAGIDCVYPESRRKVTVRRRNARELEARLAHVEDVLRGAARSKGSADAQAKPGESTEPVQQDGVPCQAFDSLAEDGCFPPAEPNDMGLGLGGFPSHGGTPGFDSDLPADDNMFGAQLMGLGMFESIPPFAMIEDLHNWYFSNHQDIVPMLHPARYLQAFHSAPHMRPPMCLQYAVWAIAANEHPKYQSYHNVFYRRARQYLEADELRGAGEHFITVAHAQAWIFIATYEARCLMLTRAAMSCARAVRLCNIMGLHRLDDPEYEMQMMPTILPAQSWLELEERRRTFWASFCVNSHVSIYSGWPGIIDTATISTNLPCSEEAFERGREEKTGKLSSLFTGATAAFSPLSSAVGVCHIFNQLLAHVNRTRANDGGGDLEHGAFWRRHREIENLLLSGFMSLPTCPSRRQLSHLDWRLGGPMHVRLNLHASVICLHMAAVDRAEAHGLAPDIKRFSHARVLMSAHEIVKITRAVAASSPPPSSPMTTYQHRTPLAALALYCAAMVYMMLIKDSEGGGSGDNNNASSSSSSSSASLSSEQWPGCRENLEYIVRRTETVSVAHPVARAFFLQLVLDLEHHGIQSAVSISSAEREGVPRFTHKIPILVRTAASRHAEDSTQASPSLSARPSSEWLPFVRPLGCAKSTSRQWAVDGNGPGFVEDDGGDVSAGTTINATTITSTAAVSTTPSTIPPPLSLTNRNHVGGKRRRVDGRQSRSPQTATAVLAHRGSPSDPGGGDGLGNVGSGLDDAYCNTRDDAGLAWTEADMDALVREFVQVDGRESELGFGQGATGDGDSASAQTTSNGSQPWGAFNF